LNVGFSQTAAISKDVVVVMEEEREAERQTAGGRCDPLMCVFIITNIQ
jgi:hypothetical protein